MKVRLEGKRVLVLGDGGEIAPAIAAALADCGASVSRGEVPAGGADLLVQISAGLAGGAANGEMERFAARARAPGVGRIVHVISAAGLVPLRGAAEHSAQQAALASLTRALAMELAPRTLVNAVAVGLDPRMVSHTALRRAGTVAEVVSAVLFLADPANTYTTGHVMAVDGGWSIGYARDF